MAIKFLHRHEIDEQQWNYCIEHATQSLPYAYTFYLDVVSPNWSALIADNYTAVMPLPIRKKYFLHYLYQPVPCPQLGVFSINKQNQHHLTHFYQAIPSFIRYINYGVNHASFCKGYGKFTTNDNYELDLNLPYEELLMNYKYNCRRTIKLSLKKNLHFVENISAGAIIKLLEDTKQQQLPQLNQQTSNQLVNLLEMLTHQNLGFSLGILNNQKQLCAAVFYIKTNLRIVNLINAGNEVARKNRWMLVLIDQIIKKHAGTNRTFDFEGSNIPSIASFFKNFGPQKKTYHTWYWNRLPIALRWIKKIK